MKKVKKRFEEVFGIPLPDAMLPSGPVVPFREDRYFMVSPSALERPFFVHWDMDVQGFVDSAPADYYALGFGGYGVDGLAFYYARVSGPIRVLFVLPYGDPLSGPYEKDVVLIREFLDRYLHFEGRLMHHGVKRMVAVDALGTATYRIIGDRGERLILPAIEYGRSPRHQPHLFDIYLEALGL